MSSRRRIVRPAPTPAVHLALAGLACALVGAVACAPGGATSHRVRPTVRALPNAPLAWEGTWELVATGFPAAPPAGSERRATLVVTRRDTAHALHLEGPPGALVAYTLTGDSAHVLWDLAPRGVPERDILAVFLHGAGDTLRGRWELRDASGPVTGRRRP